MNVKRLPFFALLALALAGCGSGGAAGADGTTAPAPKADTSGGPVTLRLKPAVGTKYKVEELSESNGKAATMILDREVKASSEKGVSFYSVVSDVKGDALLVIGLSMDTEFSPRYEVRDNKTASSNPEFKVVARNVLSTIQMAPVFPEGTVKPGDTWKTTFSLPTMFLNSPDVKVTGESNIPMECTYVGTREEGGKKLASITLKCDSSTAIKYDGKEHKVKLVLDGEFHYDLETGMLMSSVLTKSTSSDADTSSLKTTTKVELAK